MTISNQRESADRGGRGHESTGSRRIWLILIGIGLATLVAFRAVLTAPFGLIDPAEFEYWFFIPDRDSGAISVLVASWFLWNRRERFASMGAASIRVLDSACDCYSMKGHEATCRSILI